MNTFSICYFFTALYYAFIMPHLYCCFLTPKPSVRHPYWAGFCILLPDCVLCSIYPPIITFSAPLGLFLLLLLFRDTWSRRLTGFIFIYLLILVSESVSVNISFLIFTLVTGEVPRYRTTADSPGWQLITTTLLIILVGTAFALLLTPMIRKWFRYLHTGSLILIGLPIMLTMIWSALLLYNINSAYLPAYLVVILFLCAGSYLSLTRGLKQLHKQEKERIFLQNKHLLLEKQLSYSVQLEKEYRKLRKWNHDIANHLEVVGFLMEKENYADAAGYLGEIMEE